MGHEQIKMDRPLIGTVAATTSWNDYVSAVLAATAPDRAPAGRFLFATADVSPRHSELHRIAEYYGLEVGPWRPLAPETSGEDAAAALIARATTTGFHPNQLVVSTAGGPCDMIAAYYAIATGKRLVASGTFDPSAPKWPDGTESVVVVGPADLFTKPMLRRLLDRWRQEPATFGGIGVLTSRTFEQLSAIVCRQLMHRAFIEAGRRSALPASGDTVDIRSMEPLEYYVVVGHGSETHIDHGDDVLGADPSCGELNEPYWPCTEAAQLPVRRLAAHHLFVLSCDLFTPIDGLAPPANSLFHDLLGGWPSGLIAPFKHAQINNGFALLTDSLIRAGYSLGEITAILNGVAPRQAEPDAAYVLLGDPETRIFPEAVNRTAPVRIERGVRELTVHAYARGLRVIDWSISGLEANFDHEEIIAPSPLSEALFAGDLLVATMPRAFERQTRFLVVARRDLPAEELSLRVGSVVALDSSDRADLVARVARLGFLENLGVDPQVVSDLRRRLLNPLRSASSYPRAIDFLLGAAAAHNLPLLLRNELTEIRHAALNELCTGIAHDRSWFSHRYRAAYPNQRRSPMSDAEAGCPQCGSGLTRWRSDDPTGEAETRLVDICERCGIVADRPLSSPVVVTFDVTGGIHGTEHRQRFHVTNSSGRTVAVSLAAQFNQWETLGISAEPRVVALDLDPGANSPFDVVFTFAIAHPIDLVSLHCYAMSDRCEVASFTRRLVLEARPMLVEA